MAKQGQKKQKMQKPGGGGSQKGMNQTGRKGKISTQPPGFPQGRHSDVMAKGTGCFCGRCNNERLAKLV